MSRISADEIRTYIDEKDRELSETDALSLYVGELLRAVGYIAESNDAHRRARMVRRAVKGLYMRAFTAGLFRSIAIDRPEPEPMPEPDKQT